MTLLELSGEYRASAAALRERVLLLEHRLRGADGDGRRLLEGRIRLLRAMGREARLRRCLRYGAEAFLNAAAEGPP